VLVAVFAVLRKLNLSLNELFVFTRVIVGTLASNATELDEVFAEFRIGHRESE
jgi:uncharacterized protein YciU (UPF0263 family)